MIKIIHNDCYINGKITNIYAINARFENSQKCYDYLKKSTIHCAYWEKCLAFLMPTKIGKKNFIFLKTKTKSQHHQDCPYLSLISIRKLIKNKFWNFIMEKYPQKTKYINNEQIINHKLEKTLKVSDLFKIVKNNNQLEFLQRNKSLLEKLAINDKKMILLLKILPTPIKKLK